MSDRSTTAEPRARGGGAKTLLICTGVGVLLLGVVGFWFASLNAPVRFVAPTPVMPSPNARDYYVAAANALVDRDWIGWALETSTPPRSHPMPLPPGMPGGAMGMMPGGMPGGMPGMLSVPGMGAVPPPRSMPQTWTWADREALVQRNSRALALIRQGFAFSYLHAPCRSYKTDYPEFATFRDVAQLMRLSGQIDAHQSNYADAMDSCIDACEMGSNIPRGGPLIAAMVGASCQIIGRSDAWDYVDRLDAPSARRNALRMESIVGRSVTAADILTEEKWTMGSKMAETMNRPDWPRSYFTDSYSRWTDRFGGEVMSFALDVRYHTTDRRRVLQDFSAYMDEIIARCKRPYPARRPPPGIPGDPINRMVCLGYEDADFRFERNRTMNSMLSVSLALRACRTEHGKYPDTLQALVPRYLTRLPIDPFALKGTFGYRRTAKRYVLYSIGPDGIDNKGTPAAPKTPPGPGTPKTRQRMYVDVDAKGDIVAGVNGN